MHDDGDSRYPGSRLAQQPAQLTSTSGSDRSAGQSATKSATLVAKYPAPVWPATRNWRHRFSDFRLALYYEPSQSVSLDHRRLLCGRQGSAETGNSPSSPVRPGATAAGATAEENVSSESTLMNSPVPAIFQSSAPVRST